MEGLWLSIALICILFELMTLNLYTVFICLGALFAWLSVRAGLSDLMSVAPFLMVSIALIILLRPPLERWLLPGTKYTISRPDRDD